MSETTMKRAILYLRVSSRGQMETDYDDDGLSIAAQRARCIEEATKYGAEVVDEYIERAESAKTDGRPELQKMLARIREERDVDYVILWKVDRFARNRRDDANMLFEIETAGAKLISATENIDESPAGRLMHGMLASFAEYYSRNLANEVIKGATEKAKRGGTPGRAPLGYLNVREIVNGYEVRTVALDPDRAPHIAWAFETYATGLYSLSDLEALLGARGMRSRGTRKSPPQPLPRSTIFDLLRNDYYVGFVTYRGQKTPGRHEPLVSRETFDQVQAVLESHRLSGERDRKHSHYLKGSIYCGDCGRRLIYSANVGRSGNVYEYLVCAANQKGDCKMGYLPAEKVEAEVEKLYGEVEMTPAEVKRVRSALRASLGDLARLSEREIATNSRLLSGIKEKERKLLRAYENGFSKEVLNEELAQLQREREGAEQVIERLGIKFEDMEDTLEVGLRILSEGLQDAYLRATPMIRRLINQAIWKRMWIDDEGQLHAERADGFAEILALADRPASAAAPQPAYAEEAASASASAVLAAIAGTGDEMTKAPAPEGVEANVAGSINAKMVELAGLEPATSWVRSRRSSN